jgi:PAS domain S-box-containing protein
MDKTQSGLSPPSSTSGRAPDDDAGLYRSVFEGAPVGLFISKSDGTIVDANAAVLQILGYRDRDSLLATHARDVHARPDDWDEWRSRLERDGIVHGFETRFRRRDGSPVWIRFCARAIRGDDGRVLYYEGAIEDITEDRQAGEALKKSEEQLRLSQKLEAVGSLAGGVAHDFNNLLTVIAGHCDLLLSSLPADHPIRKDIEQINRAGERAAELTRQLLAFSRKQVLQPRVMDLNTVVADVEKMLRRLIGEDIELLVCIDPGLACVKADPGHMEQVIMNLAVNARDAMPQGGRLRIETANVVLDEAFCREHPPTPPGAYVMLALTDTGEGMDEHTRSRIFEPFFTTKERDKGTGLGLATVYGIVKQSGGYIWVDSEPGQGATFRVYLPRTGGPADAAQPPAAEIGPLEGRETVLLVEDDLVVRELASQILEIKGYTVLEAGDAGEARRICREHEGPIHLLLADVVMPQMGGRALCDLLVRDRPQMKVLFMSGYTDEAVMRHGVLREGSPFLQKPFTPTDLARAVRGVLDLPSGGAAEEPRA